jgi:UDPglucose--hexose-1-phosphate uridylyltransferase
MELRKDPITRSWVVVGQRELYPAPGEPCPLCPGQTHGPVLLEIPGDGGPPVRVVPHPHPLYQPESEVGRRADGLYDRMGRFGAHEVIIESPDHGARLSQRSDAAIARVLEACAQRTAELKRDPRIKYVTVFKNRGPLAGEEWTHPHLLVTATTFVPRRILYELRAARWHFEQKERCVFCDILRQEERQQVRMVDSEGDYAAFCPYASRVPFEMWIITRKHNHLFEQPRPEARRQDLAALFGRVLRRLAQVAENYHLVIHTAPNAAEPTGELTDFARHLADDYHWHIEILPIVELRSKSYSIKEIYFNPLLPEQAAERLRSLDPGRGRTNGE